MYALNIVTSIEESNMNSTLKYTTTNVSFNQSLNPIYFQLNQFHPFFPFFPFHQHRQLNKSHRIQRYHKNLQNHHCHHNLSHKYLSQSYSTPVKHSINFQFVTLLNQNHSKYKKYLLNSNLIKSYTNKTNPINQINLINQTNSTNHINQINQTNSINHINQKNKMSEKVHHWKNSKHIYSERSELPAPSIVKDWKSLLTDEEYRVLRQQGTEFAGTGKYYMHFEEGVYTCKCCQTPLFHSDAKYKCTCGWPGFVQPINEDAITYLTDLTHGMHRIETICTACHAHLGHVFLDGPKPTNHRYCINSICLNFNKNE